MALIGRIDVSYILGGIDLLDFKQRKNRLPKYPNKRMCEEANGWNRKR